MGGGEKVNFNSRNAKNANTTTPTTHTMNLRNTAKGKPFVGTGTDVAPSSPRTKRSDSVASADSFELLERKLLKNLSQIITEKFDEFEEFLTQKLDAVTTSFNHELGRLSAELNSVKDELLIARREIEEIRRVNRLTDIIITGLPFMEHEDPQKTLANISSAINHTLSPYSTAFRVGGKRTHSSHRKKEKNSPLIVKFSSSSEQRSFLRKFKQHGIVTLNQISELFSSDSRINAYESLTRHNNQILRRAVKYRRDKAIFSAFTRNGLVYVRIRESDSPTHIDAIEELDKLISKQLE